MKTKKKFDCIRMKDDAQMRRSDRLKDLTPEERMSYYQQAHEALDRRQKQLRQQGPAMNGRTERSGQADESED